MLNAKKSLRANNQQGSLPNDCTALLKYWKKDGLRRSNSISRLAKRSTQYSTSRFSNLIRFSDRPNREQPPQEPEDVQGELEWQVKTIVKSEIISYKRKVRRVNKEFKEL